MEVPGRSVPRSGRRTMLTQLGRKRNYHTDYMIMQFERISRELSEQICLDGEKMY